MPSPNQTKTNIDLDMDVMVKRHAKAKNISGRKMLRIMIAYYVAHNKTTNA